MITCCHPNNNSKISCVYTICILGWLSLCILLSLFWLHYCYCCSCVSVEVIVTFEVMSSSHLVNLEGLTNDDKQTNKNLQIFPSFMSSAKILQINVKFVFYVSHIGHAKKYKPEKEIFHCWEQKKREKLKDH